MKHIRLKFIKNSILFVASTVLFLTTLISCDGLKVGNDFLEKPPSEDVTLDTIFSRADAAKEFLWHAYEALPYGLPVDGAYDTDVLYGDVLACLTDINFSINNNGGHRYYYAGNYNAGLEAQPFLAQHFKYNFYKSGAWESIREAYIFINNVDKVPDMDETTKQRLKAEARMIIALQYARLFRNYGGMFWIDHYVKPSEEGSYPRLTARATLDSIVEMIDKAIPYLPFVLSDPATQAGRFTQAGAMGLKCRILLFGASPLFNSDAPYMAGTAASKKLVWYGGFDPSLWEEAADAYKALIDKNQQMGMPYHLVNTGHPREDFTSGYYDRSSPELLISTRKRFKASGMPGNLINGGHYNTTDNYVKMFPMADGTLINQPGSGYDPTHPYQNRDPRLYETILTNGDTYQSRTAELWIGGRERKTLDAKNARTGYRGRKFVLDIKDARGNPVQWPYLRLSEIYLSYAEVLNQVNGGPTAEAYKYVNLVRNRVGLDDLQNSMKNPSSQEEFRKRVLRERVLELGYENVRWYDMIRYKMKDVFTKPLYGMNIYKKGTAAAASAKDLGYGYHESNKYIYVRFKLDPRFWAAQFSPKWYLSAFPKTEVQKVYGLIQNPGW